MKMTVDQRDKNRAKQRKYLANLKNSNMCRITATVSEKTLDRIRELARMSNITLGQVIDRIFEEESEIGASADASPETDADVIKEDEGRPPLENSELSRYAIDLISAMLRLNARETQREEAKDNPDAERLRTLQERRKQYLNEQMLVYRGNKKIMKTCIEQYSPLVKIGLAKEEEHMIF